MENVKCTLQIAVCLVALLPAMFAVGQEVNNTNNNVTFPAAYFAEFAPITVNDMLDRVPGIELIRQGTTLARDGDRGLGADSSILIDGKRLAGKANETDAQLERISADQVNYIEIIRGTSSDLDVQNTGQLVNIVLYESESQSNLSAEAFMDYHENGKSMPGGSLAFSGQSGAWSYLLSGEVSNNYNKSTNFETSLNGDFSPNENIDWERTSESTEYSLNANLTYIPSSQDRFALNLLYAESEPDTKVDRLFFDFNGPTERLYTEREAIPAQSDNWEIGGDYEHGFANGDRFKALFIVNEDVNDTLRERFITDFIGDEERQSLFLDTYSRYRERIVRSSYIHSLSSSQGVEFGIEVAETTQDSNLLIATPPSIPGNNAFGGLTPVPLPNANSTVEEIRYEPFLIHNWQINSRLSLESSLVGEWSEISQQGDIANERDFDYLKPKFDLRFNINSSLQARTSLENVVSQLSFSDFSRNINERDDDQDTVAGNPELEPEESWRLEVGLDYRLPNDGGAINARYFHYEYDNKIGKIDISPSPTNLVSTNGNIGQAQAYGLIVNASIRLGFLGLPSALFTGYAQVQESEFDDDPLVPREHGFPPFDRGSFRFSYRHDITDYNLSYGVTWAPRLKDGRRSFDIDNEADFVVPDILTAFVEMVGFGGLPYRLEGRNLADFENCGIRYRYEGYVAASPYREIEQNCARTGRNFSFKVRGTF